MLTGGASETVDAQPLPLDRLSTHPQWLKLLRYERSGISPVQQSAIKSPEFFLSATGRQDPLAELQATLQALQSTAPTADNQHAVCRFPARALWLGAQLGDQLTLPKNVNCPDFDAWTRHNTVDSISVVFATGYLGNPASYYGHTLLKLNYRDAPNRTQLMDVSVNYGAIVEGNDDPLSYIVKGIFGGYDGGFSHIGFYFHNHNYGETELRDLWEYELQLPAPVVELIAAHAWEVLGKRYTYYFFRRNCAFRMAELLEVSDDIHLLGEWRPWTIPQSLVQSLEDSRIEDQPLVSSVRYHPSRQSRLYARYQDLTPAEQRHLKQLVEQAPDVTQQSMAGQPLATRHRLLDTLLDYYQFVRDQEAGINDPSNLAHKNALAERYRLPPGGTSFLQPTPAAAHQGRKPGWLQLSAVHDEQHNKAFGLRVRPAYYDPLDADAGHVRNGALGMADLRLTARHGQLRLRQLDIINIETISPGLTGLPGDRSKAWNLKFGVEPARLDCDSCRAVRLQGDRGIGLPIGQSLMTAVYIGGAVQEQRFGEGHALARLSSRLIYTRGEFSGRLNTAYHQPTNGAGGYKVTSIEARKRLGTNTDLRLLFEHNRGNELSLGLGWYW